MFIVQRIAVQAARQRGECHTLAVGRAVALLGELQRARLHRLGKRLRFGDLVHQAPVFGGAGQHAEQRHLRQADRAGAVVHQNDFVAGQRQLVAATGASAVDGREEFQAAVLGRVFQTVAGFVGELAKVHLPGVAGDAEHEDVGARAKHLVFCAGDHHRAHGRVLEADALHRVVQLNIDPQVVAVELELVARAKARVLIKVGFQRGDHAVDRQRPVAVLAGVGAVIDLFGQNGVQGGGCVHGGFLDGVSTDRQPTTCIILHVSDWSSGFACCGVIRAGPARLWRPGAAAQRWAPAAGRWCSP